MHMQGDPQTMQVAPEYGDVTQEVFGFLQKRIDSCVQAGIPRERIFADVGIGFGKTPEHNMKLLRDLDIFKGLGVRHLLGASRKKFIEAVAGKASPEERIGGSLAAALWGLQKGVDIVRVHDVKATKQAFALWNSLRLE